MNIKDVIEIKEDLTIKDDGMKIDFTPEESDRLKEIARMKGIPPEELIEQVIDKSLHKAKDRIEKLVRNKKKK